jgi:crossover junction endodeoxyribonuclease RuvC
MIKQTKSQSVKESVVMGVDPGTIITGFGIVREEGTKMLPLDYGCIKPPASKKLSDRYWIIYSALLDLMNRYRPDTVVVETQYVSKNVQSAMKLGMARGGVIIAAKSKGLPIYEYSPTKAKLAVTGSGRAGKEQVQAMTQRLLNLPAPPEPDDAADALALAICHLHAKQSYKGVEI